MTHRRHAHPAMRPELRDLPPARPRVRGHPRHPRGRGRARARRAAVLRRQGLARAAAPGREGVPARRRFPFPVMHVDTGHNFPEVIEYRDRLVEELGARLIVASVQDSIDNGRVIEETGPRASRNRLQTVTLLDAIEEHGFKAAFGGARRDEERARAKERIFSLPRRLRPVGPQGPAARALEPLQRLRQAGRARARVPALELDRARRVAVHRARRSSSCRSIYFAHEREVFKRDGMLYAALRLRRAAARRGAVRGVGALPHRRRHELHRRGALRRRRRSRTWWPRSPPRASPSAARRAPTTASPRPPWRTARRRATSSMAVRRGHERAAHAARTSELVRFATAGSVDDGKSTLIGRLLFDTKSIFEDQLEHVEETSQAARRRLREPRAAHRRPARRARAGHHDRRGLPLLPHAAAQVHHRRHARATSSTRATWSRAPPPRTWRWSSSTRARACSSSRAATRSSPRCCASRTWWCA